MLKQDIFPLTVVFEDGSREAFYDEHDLICNLESFNSSKDTGCSVVDRYGRSVYLVIDKLELKTGYVINDNNICGI